METGALGKEYGNGEVVVRQGEEGNCLYVIQAGEVEVFLEKDGKEIRLAVLREGDFFGEMALFEKEHRSATVRSLGKSRLLTVDRKTFLRRIQEDPSLAFRIVQAMSNRIRKLHGQLIESQADAQTTIS